MNLRNTKQKELVLNILKCSVNHPTIEEIYHEAKKIDSNIGQATIYRNIKKLLAEEKIIKLPSTTAEKCHYDGNIIPHNHLFCKSCGKIIDLSGNDYTNIIKNIEKKYSVKIEKIQLLLEGTCSKCQRKI